MVDTPGLRGGAPHGPTRRLFFALWPSDDVAAALDREARALAAECGGRAMRRDTLHLTLNFLGNVAEKELPWICRAVDGLRAEPFTLVLDTLGYWPHNRIVWAGSSVPVPAVGELATAIAARLRGSSENGGRTAFTPHLTLLRKAAKPAVTRLSEPLVWSVREWVLVESVLTSHGARYQPLARWPL